MLMHEAVYPPAAKDRIVFMKCRRTHGCDGLLARPNKGVASKRHAQIVLKPILFNRVPSARTAQFTSIIIMSRASNFTL